VAGFTDSFFDETQMGIKQKLNSGDYFIRRGSFIRGRNHIVNQIIFFKANYSRIGGLKIKLLLRIFDV